MRRRVAIIGTGWVGASVAISTLHSGISDELLLNDAREAVAEGEAMDLAHGAAFYPPASVTTASIEEMQDADAVVITAGRGGRPGESRLELLQGNAAIITRIGERLRGCRGMVIMVTNPVDVLTRLITEVTGLPPSRVIGTGTMLDTARLKHVIGRVANVGPHSVHAHVVGEHGDSEVVLWSAARIAGVPLPRWPGWDSSQETILSGEVKHAAHEIIARKGATNHAIGLTTADLLSALLRDERRVLTVSRVQEGALGLHDVALSLPAIVGAEGVSEVIEPEMSDDERTRVLASADVLRRAGTEIQLTS